MPEQSSDHQQRRLYQHLLTYVDNSFPSDEPLPQIIAFERPDGTYRFSVSDSHEMLQKIATEAGFSDRLLVIVCFAYLEDQLKVLLTRFLTQDDLTKSIAKGRVPFYSMSQWALALGLLTKDWYDTLAMMATVRNDFAHDWKYQSFASLKPATVETLKRHSQKYLPEQNALDAELHPRNLKDGYFNLFWRMYAFIQYSIDHIAPQAARLPLDQNEVIGVHHFAGITRTTIEDLIAGNWQSLDDLHEE